MVCDWQGFGALCLQYALYGAVLKFAQVIIREVTLALVPPKPKPKTQVSVGQPGNMDCLDLSH